MLLVRPKWNTIADDLRVEINRRLKKQGLKTSAWKTGDNPVARLLGKELVLLAWAIEDADPALIPNAIQNWRGLEPEERWWLYTMTAARPASHHDRSKWLAQGRALRADREPGAGAAEIHGTRAARCSSSARRRSAWPNDHAEDEPIAGLPSICGRARTRRRDMTAAPRPPPFIEVQFPVSKLSKESYKERKANAGQTLTGLGKWWGRKPLGPGARRHAGPAAARHRRPRRRTGTIFLKLMTMDEEGLWRRKNKSHPACVMVDAQLTPRGACSNGLRRTCDAERPRFRRGRRRRRRRELQRCVFDRSTYDGKLDYCVGPSRLTARRSGLGRPSMPISGPTHTDLPELVRELGERRFGHIPRVGDAFCGGGSVPFEAARLGCEAYGSDLNPVAALLTWGALHIVGGGPEVAEQVRRAQAEVFAAVDRQVTEWGIEHNEDGWRADAYLYCTRSCAPECGWRVPLAPSWVIGEKTRTIARLVPDPAKRRFEIEIEQGVSKEELAARKSGTTRDARLHCPNCPTSTPIIALRRDRRVAEGTAYGLRPWENDDLVPRPEMSSRSGSTAFAGWRHRIRGRGRAKPQALPRAGSGGPPPRGGVLELLRERFHDWQTRATSPAAVSSRATNRRTNTHALDTLAPPFTPRQLLMHGR